MDDIKLIIEAEKYSELYDPSFSVRCEQPSAGALGISAALWRRLRVRPGVTVSLKNADHVGLGALRTARSARYRSGSAEFVYNKSETEEVQDESWDSEEVSLSEESTGEDEEEMECSQEEEAAGAACVSRPAA
ncbi:unnamed protein product [Pleuronectes platessa]|uniref:Uncharacterized protein n=1 Tax=Pleuronectes platessa TaxID=8262 RepID=A0A9N7UU40_PLEPL|nr:unnamed protein product [Pleuronectes platessa]